MLPLHGKRHSFQNGHSSNGKHRKGLRIVGLLLVCLAALWLIVTLMLPSGLDRDVISRKADALVQQMHSNRAPPSAVSADGGHTYTMTMASIYASMTSFLAELHEKYTALPPSPTPLTVWGIYKAAADRWLLPLDRDHRGKGLFPVREDNSIFVSTASYRDENCATTLKEMFTKADHPERLYVGLVQQNCVADCMTGVLEGGIVESTEPDEDCYEEFCASPEGRGRCEAADPHVRMLFVQEAESLGPAVARYFASKLWQGENYFMQIDSHSLFDAGWDTAFVRDIQATPSYPLSVLTHYPPDTNNPRYGLPAHRICGAEFATSDIEQQIIRLSVSDQFETEVRTVPCYAPFIGAGFVFAHSSFLSVAPFDPYVPWVFMGEEIQFSIRVWTWGYDIYSPTQNKMSHFYVRQHKPKFWER